MTREVLATVAITDPYSPQRALDNATPESGFPDDDLPLTQSPARRLYDDFVASSAERPRRHTRGNSVSSTRTRSGSVLANNDVFSPHEPAFEFYVDDMNNEQATYTALTPITNDGMDMDDPDDDYKENIRPSHPVDRTPPQAHRITPPNSQPMSIVESPTRSPSRASSIRSHRPSPSVDYTFYNNTSKAHKRTSSEITAQEPQTELAMYSDRVADPLAGVDEEMDVHMSKKVKSASLFA